jgi:hypothetical protein
MHNAIAHDHALVYAPNDYDSKPNSKPEPRSAE